MEKLMLFILKIANLIPPKVWIAIVFALVTSCTAIPIEYRDIISQYSPQFGVHYQTSENDVEKETVRDSWVEQHIKDETKKLLTEGVWDPEAAVKLIELIETKEPISEKNRERIFFLKMKYRAFFYEEVSKEE